jgi:hypothetical protein
MKGETPNKGIAAEIVLLRDHQEDLNFLTESTDETNVFNASSNSDAFIDKKTGQAIIIQWTDPKTKIVIPRPLSDFSLFDADGKNASIDFKYEAHGENVDVQYSKIHGNTSCLPIYTEINGKLKLYNVWCHNTKKFINKNNNTDTYIVAKTPTILGSWNMTDFIQKNIKENEKVDAKLKDSKGYTIKPSFIQRMVKEGKINVGVSHDQTQWFTINSSLMKKK